MIKFAIVTALVLIAGLSTAAQSIRLSTFGGSGAYIDIRAFGAKGDCKTDDSPAIMDAAIAATLKINGNTIYFPATKACYLIRTPLVLPPAPRWTELYLDSAVALLAPIILNDFYILHGNNGNDPSSFSQDHETIIAAFMTDQQVPIQIHGKWGVRLENFKLFGPSNTGQDNILIDQTSGNITLYQVDSEPTPDNLTGSALHIKGGGIFNIIGGVYTAPAVSPMPAIEVEGDPDQCTLMGLFKVTDSIFTNRGIRLNMDRGCGVFAQLEADNILYQDGSGPFLQTIGLHGSLNAGIIIRNLSISDGTANSTCLANEGSAWNFQVFDCLGGNNQAITQGDIIQDLEIWSLGSEPVGQSSQYVYHGMNGIVSTMQTLSTESKAPPPLTLPNMNLRVPRVRSIGRPTFYPPPASSTETP